VKISTLKEVIMLSRQARFTPFIWGYHGIGKSSIVKQTMMENMLGMVDMRCSQLEASDIRGLPTADMENNRTIYLPPADMPIANTTFEDFYSKYSEIPDEEKETYWAKMQPFLKAGTLFLDEVNRAQDDVLQALFQLVYDRRVGQYVLPSGWGIVCAGNFMEGYQTNGFTDPAFLDRFCHVTLSNGEPTLEEWVRHMVDIHGQNAQKIIEFTSHNLKHLDADIEGELGFAIKPSRRSWDTVTRILQVCEESAKSGKSYSEEAKTEAIAGLVGREVALAFTRYDCPVKPNDLLRNGVEPMKDKLKTLTRNQITGLVWGLVGFAKPKIKEDKIAKVVCDFAEWMCKHHEDKDIVVCMCKSLVTSDSGTDRTDPLRVACLTNSKLAKLIGNSGSQTFKHTLIDRLNQRPSLQSLLSDVAWGKD
jgi:MoxR-like ATPase